MSKAMKLMLVVAIVSVAVAAVAQNTIGGSGSPASGSTQTPTYNNGSTSPVAGYGKWGTTPTGANAMDTTNYAFTPGQQFNSKWQMVGGNHDLTTYTIGTKTTSWAGGTVKQSSICSFCHTAHDNEGDRNEVREFLWAHSVPASYSYPVYTSSTFQAAGQNGYDPTSQTAQCLGCHDGSVAVTSGAYGTPGSPASGVPGATADFSVNGTALTSGGKLLESTGLLVPLSRTHPVSFTYDSGLAAKHQLRVPANANSIDGYGIVPLFNGKMECATCHDPHIKSGIMRRQFPTGASQDNGSGSFCLYCHL